MLWICFSGSIVFHEIGHFAVGRAVGFRLHSLQLGLVRISFEFGNLRVSLVPAGGIGGFAAMHIRTFSRLRRNLAKFVFGGPANNLLCAAVATILVRMPSLIPDMRLRSLLASFGVTSLFCGLLNRLPLRLSGGFYTDGARLLLLRKRSERVLRWYAIMGIGMQQRTGRRPREWNRRWVEMATSLRDSSRDLLLGSYLSYLAASDCKDEAAARALEQCLSVLPPIQVPFRDLIINEAGIFQAWFRHDADKSSVWFERVKHPRKLHPILRVRANVVRNFVRGNFDPA